MFAREPPDLLILDVELPGRSGLEICNTLRGTPLGTDVPIVVVTAHNDTASIADAYLAGATDFIPKPVLWQTLPQRLGFILRAQDNIRALRLSEQKNRALLQALPDTIYIVDKRGVLMEHITGVEHASPASLVGRSIEDVVPPEVARAGRRAIEARPEERAVTNHEFDVGSGAERRCFETRLRPQADGSLLVVTRDTTERRRAEARIKYLAYYDTLTGLPNRQAFVREAGRAMRAARRTARPSRCCISISTASSASTTTWAMPRAMRCSRAWRCASSRACGRRTRRAARRRITSAAASRGLAATSSWCC